MELRVPLLANKFSADWKMQMNDTEYLRKVSGHSLPDTHTHRFHLATSSPGARPPSSRRKLHTEPYPNPIREQKRLRELQDLAKRYQILLGPHRGPPSRRAAGLPQGAGPTGNNNTRHFYRLPNLCRLFIPHTTTRRGQYHWPHFRDVQTEHPGPVNVI